MDLLYASAPTKNRGTNKDDFKSEFYGGGFHTQTCAVFVLLVYCLSEGYKACLSPPFRNQEAAGVF